MISSVEITRFRGIREGKLEDLTPLVVLVGPNGCGKSSVLDALLIAASTDPADGIATVVDRHRGVNDGPRWLFWRPREQPSAEVAVDGTDNAHSVCRLRLAKAPSSPGSLISWQIESEYGKTRRSGAGNVVFDVVGKRVAGADSGDAFRATPSVRLVESHSDTPVPLHQLYSENSRRGRRGETKQLVGELAPGVEDVEILTEGDVPVVYFVYKDGAVPAALAGDGIFALVQLVLHLGACDAGLLLLEEPEVHQHPGAIRQTMRAILAAVRRDIQVVLTTHSLELIDCLLAESSDEDLERLSLYRLQLDDGALVSHRMSGPDVSFARTQIENDLR